MTACPSADQLRALLYRQSSLDLPADLAAHVQKCPACQALLSQWNQDGVNSTAQTLPTDSGDSHPVVPGYEIVEKLGRGGMGVVWKARHLRLDRVVALKLIRAGADADTEVRKRFLKEAQAIACLQHPHIVQIHEVGETEGQPFCALEFVDGQSLDRRLATGPLPAPTAATLVFTLARAIHYAHEHEVVHRDLKPSNVLLAGRREAPVEGCQPKITDFGLAKRLNQERDTHSGAVLGTPSYMAPEQAEGKSYAVGPPTDVYGLGAILYETLTGRPPFQGTSPLQTLELVRQHPPVAPRHWQPQVPRDLETICLKCLEKEPTKRYASAGDLADDVRRFLDGKPILARRVRLHERGWRWCRRQPVLAALLALLVVAVGGGVTGITVQWRRALANEAREAAARQRAEANSRAARKFLAEFVPVGQFPHFQALGFTPLHTDVLERANHFYLALLQERESGADAEGDVADILTSLGALNHAQGRYDRAEVYARQAIQLWHALRRADPADRNLRLGLARASQVLGQVYHDQPTLAGDALTWIERAQVLWEELATESPAEEFLWYQANTRRVRASLLANFEHRANAHPVLLDDLAFMHRLARAKATTPYALEYLAQTYYYLGTLYRRERSWDEALRCLHEAARLGQEVLVVAPGNVGALLEQAEYYHALTLLAGERGTPLEPYRTAALQAYERAGLAHLRWFEFDPTNAGLAVRLGVVIDRLQAHRTTAGAPPLARQTYERFMAVVSEVVRRIPANRMFGKEFLELRCHLASLLHDARQPAAALEIARQTVAVLCQPDCPLASDANGRFRRAVYFRRLSHVVRRAGALDEALDLVQRSLQTIQQLAQESPGELRLASELSESWQQLSKAHWVLGQIEETLTALRQAVEVQKRVLELAPTVVEYRHSLGNRYLRLGRKLCELGQLDEAETCFKQRSQLWPDEPEKHREALRELQKWAEDVGEPGQPLTQADILERQRYLELRERLARVKIDAKKE